MKRTFDEANENPSYKDVILHKNDNILNKINLSNLSATDDSRTKLLGLKAMGEWSCSTVINRPGLMFIKNPFTSLGQRYWIRKCLEEYSQKPNKTNIDIERIINDWWTECYADGMCDMQLQKKLRWTTLGYHHNWDTKVYSEDNKSSFPEDLAELCDCIAQYLGYKDFKAEAAIVNYYHLDSTLSAHTDHSEINLDAPLFFFSFGQPELFFIQPEKSLKTSAFVLESGDIAIMSKEARFSYHTEPWIVSTPVQPWNNNEDLHEVPDSKINFKYISNEQMLISDLNRNIDNQEWDVFNQYVKESRINMNVRQVLNVNQKSLYDWHF